MLDVAIIGGGPVGSRAAYQLAGMGYEVSVFEKRAGIGQKPCCTGIISQECVRKFDIPESVIFKQLNSAKVFSHSGEFVRVSKPQSLACILNRPGFDRDMAARAQSRGAVYHLGSRIEETIFFPDKVVLNINSNSQIDQIEARAVIYACGFSSSLINSSGLGRINYCVAGAQTEIEINGLQEVEVYFRSNPCARLFCLACACI